MIPDLDPDDYNSDNEIPEETLLIISAAITKFEAVRIDSLLSGASKSYLKGSKGAYSKLKEPFVSDEVKKEAEKYLNEYKNCIMDGYTVIQGKKVYWLRDRTLKERQKIFDIVKEGISENKGKEILTRKLQDYFNLQKTQSELIAGNETQYVQARARDTVYLNFGVERLRWITAAHPCSVCEEFEGRVYTWDDLPYQQPVHIRCLCDLEPVFY